MNPVVSTTVNPKYFLTDLDGTLLNASASLSDYTVQVLNEALIAGHVIAFATARSLVSAKLCVAHVHWRHPVILFNGALIMDYANNHVIRGHFVDGEVADEALSIGRMFGVTPFVYLMSGDGREEVQYESAHNDGERGYLQSRANDPRFRRVDAITVAPDVRLMALSYIAPHEKLESLYETLRTQFGDEIHLHFTQDTYLREYYFLEISHPSANKRSALLTWASLVGCDAAEITVFGDNLNDLGLFAAAGQRVAVANAHPDLKAMADRVVASHDEDGVARYIASNTGFRGMKFRFS